MTGKIRRVVAGVAEVAVSDLGERPAVWSRIVRMSASIWVGCHSSVSPFQTGTPAYLPRVSTLACAEPRYSIPSNIRPSTRAVSLIDSLCPICDPVGPEVGDVRPLVVGADLEGAHRAGGGLLEDEGDVAACQVLVLARARLSSRRRPPWSTR